MLISRPLAEMDMTPLINVQMVLLVMFVISIPAATHSVNLDLPASCETSSMECRKASKRRPASVKSLLEG